MATEPISSRLLPVNFTSKPSYSLVKPTMDEGDAEKNDESSHGAQFQSQRAFLGKGGKQVTVTPLIVDFRRLLQSVQTRTSALVPGISNRDLLHATVGLYDVSLSDMTPDVLYATVCERWAHSILLIRDEKDVLEEMEARRKAKLEKSKEGKKSSGDGPSKEADSNPEVNGDAETETQTDAAKSADADVTKEGAKSDENDDVLECMEQKPGKFDEVFSDTDEETDEGGDDDEEDFSKGIQSFLAAVAKRREAREKHKGELLPEHVGVENKIVAAATYKKAYCSKPSEKVIHLTLLAVRLRFRKWGIGKYLLQQVKNPLVVGQYDAVVVHADNDAVDFFQRYGFTDDTVLNNKWSELAEQFTNCTLMCYLPPFTGQTMLSESVPELDLIAMEKEVKKWRQKAQEAYIAEMTCMGRMRHEIIHLRALVSSQQDLIKSLMAENEKVRKEKFLLEREFLDYRLNAVKSTFGDQEELDEDDDMNTDQLLKDLEKEVERSARRKQMLMNTRAESKANRFYLSRNAAREPYCHGRDTEEFYQVTQEFADAMKKDPTVVTQYSVKMVSKAMLPPSVDEQIYSQISQLQEPTMVTRLYYSGSLENPDYLIEILKNGFSEKNFSIGEYGRGLYFSKYPSKAAQFSAFGKIIVAEVGLGNTQTVVKKDRTRSQPDSNYESIITPGRLIPSEADNKDMLCQEYIIFNPNQARPLYLIEYSPVSC